MKPQREKMVTNEDNKPWFLKYGVSHHCRSAIKVELKKKGMTKSMFGSVELPFYFWGERKGV